MTADSINMNEEEFESYFSGTAMPPGSWQSSLLMCEGLQVMSQNIALLSDLKTRQNKVLSEALKLKEEMESFQTEIHTEVQEVLNRTKYEIRGPKKPVTVDEGEIPSDMLPSPLLPAPAAAMTVPSKDPAPALPPQDLPSPLNSGPVAGAAACLLPSPLLPTPAFTVSAAVAPPPPSSTAEGKSQIGIEDFLSSSQASSSSMSLLDLSLTAQQLPCPSNAEEEQLQQLEQEQLPQPEQLQSQQQQEPQEDEQLQEDPPSFEASFNEQEYRGFSAQSSTIPSISCDNAKEDEMKE